VICIVDISNIRFYFIEVKVNLNTLLKYIDKKLFFYFRVLMSACQTQKTPTPVGQLTKKNKIFFPAPLSLHFKPRLSHSERVARSGETFHRSAD